MGKVAIVVAYKSGTPDMFRTWLRSVSRHTKMDVRIIVVTEDDGREAGEVVSGLFGPGPSFVGSLGANFVWEVVGLNKEKGWVPSGRIHGAMLDAVIPSMIIEPFLLTIDSDCFPVADGWLEDMISELADPGVGCAGILHPWKPPREDMPRNKIEWRVRSQHCWETTHVACQMMRMADWREGFRYAGGDDTGLVIPSELKKAGLRCAGFMASRCARPEDGFMVDPEFNRMVTLIFGDKVYHHGGHTRGAFGEERDFEAAFSWVESRIFEEGGAEFLLDDDLSYRYKFDREEEVAEDKMQRIFGMVGQRRF